MPQELASLLRTTVDREADRLWRITDDDAAKKPSAGAWSKKQELGHLIDSAANNHVRFVQASLQPEFRGSGYEQEGWVDRHGYGEMPWAEVVDFWQRYNSLLAVVVRRIPENRLETPCVVGNSETVTLRFLIEDYVAHMQHHLDHILQRDQITEYPGAAKGV